MLNLHSNKPFTAVPGRAAGRGAAGGVAGVQVGGVWQCYTPPTLLKRLYFTLLLFIISYIIGYSMTYQRLKYI
jgi:hypothetical protein